MNDLIDRRAAIDAVKNTDVVVLYHDTEPVEEAIEEAIEATKRSITTGIEGLPSAQPEIVRCKDCKLFGNSEQLPSAQPEIIRCKDCKHTKHCGPGKVMCQNGKIHELDWYCADGERRKDKTDGCRST